MGERDFFWGGGEEGGVAEAILRKLVEIGVGGGGSKMS